MQQRKNSYRVGPGAQAVEHGSYLCESACDPRDTPCQKRKVANVLRWSPKWKQVSATREYVVIGFLVDWSGMPT